MRVLLETSITRFVRTGLGIYATNLHRALQEYGLDVEVLCSRIPIAFGMAPHSLVQKIYAAYWQIIHARAVVPHQAKQLGCDLIHYTMTMPIPLTLPCPAVATVHDLIPFVHPTWVQPLRGRRMRHGIALAATRAQHLITDSEATRRDVLRHFKRPPESVTTVFLGANSQLPRLHVGEAKQLVRDQFRLSRGYILCVGSIEPRKNLERVIAAYSNLRRRQHNAPPLVLVGTDVGHQNRIRSQIAAERLESKVICTGHVPAAHLAALLQCAGVFVYPSLYEGFGLPPLEAMEFNCPVITSNTSSLPEVVGDAALKVDPYNVEHLTDAMKLVLQDHALAERLRQRGREHVKRFSWQRCAEETIEVYRRILEAAEI